MAVTNRRVVIAYIESPIGGKGRRPGRRRGGRPGGGPGGGPGGRRGGRRGDRGGSGRHGDRGGRGRSSGRGDGRGVSRGKGGVHTTGRGGTVDNNISPDSTRGDFSFDLFDGKCNGDNTVFRIGDGGCRGTSVRVHTT